MTCNYLKNMTLNYWISHNDSKALFGYKRKVRGKKRKERKKKESERNMG